MDLQAKSYKTPARAKQVLLGENMAIRNTAPFYAGIRVGSEFTSALRVEGGHAPAILKQRNRRRGTSCVLDPPTSPTFVTPTLDYINVAEPTTRTHITIDVDDNRKLITITIRERLSDADLLEPDARCRLIPEFHRGFDVLSH
jgi:hypothetical protein